MNYFNLIFSNKSILRIFQLEIFKKIKINGDIIEFGASEKVEKNFCNNQLKNCKITYSNINPSNKEFLNIDLQKEIYLDNKYDYIVIFNVLEHLLDPNKGLKIVKELCHKDTVLYIDTNNLWVPLHAWKKYNYHFHYAHPYTFSVISLSNLLNKQLSV